MRLLITGNRGFIGKYVESKLINAGHQIIGYDISDGLDILKYETLLNKSQNCEVIIHLAAIENTSSQKIIENNLLGMWNILEAGKNVDIKKIIFMSSVDTLGIFQGEGTPKYLPIDDEYPCHPNTPYAISKLLSEEMCSLVSNTTNIPIFCIRAPGVWDASTYDLISSNRKNNPEYEWKPYWEYGAFIDVRDLAEAILLSLQKTIIGFHRFLIASNDITTSGMTTEELVSKIHPKVFWKGNNEYKSDPYKSLIICDKIKKTLGWSPKYSWKLYKNQKSL